MDLRELSNSELLELAYTTAEVEILELLASFENMFVRRAVARNSNTPPNIVNILAMDPVMNVSYMALKHTNCTLNRALKNEIHMCVSCEEDERYMDCSMCNL